MASKKPSVGQNIEQGINIGTVSSQRDTNISQVASIQRDIVEPTNSAEFVAALGSLIEELRKYDGLDPDVKEVRKELEAAAAEAKQPQPNGSLIRRFMSKAKGLLESISEVAAPLVPLVTTIAELTKKVPDLFNIVT